MPKYFENEVQPRRRELTAKETGIITDDMAARLRINSKNLFLETAGIDLGDDWEVPRTSIIPRMFIMKQDKDGHDRIMTFESAGIKPGSKEFWTEAAKGNVFVFPAGQREPSQLQYEPSNLETKISFSKPVPPKKMPDPPVRPLTFWQKVQNLFTGKFRRENTAWNSRAQDKDYTAQQLKNHIEIREDFLDPEKRETEKKIADHKEKQIQARLDSDYDLALRDANAVDKCAKRMVNIFRPEPVVDNELLPKKAGAASFYSMDQFNALTRFPKDGPDGFDLDSIEIGTSGHKATVEDFTAVTMFALWDDELAMKASKMKLQDPYAKQSLMDNGFTEAEIDTTLASHTRNFYTCDLFIAKPRENLGDWHKPVTNVGRKAAVDAFKDYQKGDKGKLAAIIADGINKSAKNTAGLEGKVSAQDKAWIHNSGKLAELLEKDPELRVMAEKKGMKPENLRTVTGMAKVGKMIVEADKANAEIAKARAQHRDLTADEKMKYAKTVVKAKLAQARIASENSAPNPGLDEKKDEAYDEGAETSRGARAAGRGQEQAAGSFDLEARRKDGYLCGYQVFDARHDQHHHKGHPRVSGKACGSGRRADSRAAGRIHLQKARNGKQVHGRTVQGPL